MKSKESNSWQPLIQIEDLNKLIQESTNNPVVIFKHSTRCYISQMVLKRFEQEMHLLNGLTIYYLDLLKYRSISNDIASIFKVTHQSPQILLIKDGICIYNASHENIEVNEIVKYL